MLHFDMNRTFNIAESRIMQIIGAGFDMMESAIIWECDMADCALRQAEIVATNHGLEEFTLGYMIYQFNEFMRLAGEVSATDSSQREFLIRKAHIIADFLGWDISEQVGKIRRAAQVSEKKPEKVVSKSSEFQQLVQAVELMA
jgi:hypothetical protein